MRSVATLSALVVAVSIFAACSSTSDTSSTAADQGPLTGTYSADSLDGTAPFVAITFTDGSHYQYVAKSCIPQDDSEPGTLAAGDDAGPGTPTTDDDAGDPAGDDAGDDGGNSGADAGAVASYADLGDDPGDQVADNGATPDFDADPTDNGCIHSGTYKVTEATLSLTDDGASSSVDLPMAALAPDGSEVGDPAASLTSAPAQSKALSTDSLTVGSGQVISQGQSSAAALIFGQASLSQFSAGGTRMRRTGLSNGSGIGSACVIGTGAQGTCMATSSCAGMSNYVSTAGYCPGPDDVQCCTAGPSTGSGATPSSLVTDSAVAEARDWVTAKMPYCQAVQGGRELDRACFRVHGHTCNRTGAANNPVWNAYRSDCSGLVSFAWKLHAPGLTTSGFVPSAAKYIPMQDLQPGDALLRAGHHIVLFEAWTNKSAGQAKVLSEPGCASSGGAHAQEQNWSMNRAPGAATSAHWAGATYYAVRNRKGSTLLN